MEKISMDDIAEFLVPPPPSTPVSATDFKGFGTRREKCGTDLGVLVPADASATNCPELCL
eukprot:2886387-Rhodomonas_salina.2